MRVRLAWWSVVAAAAVSLPGVAAPAAAAGPTPVVRLAGSDRIATSIAVLDALGPGQSTVSVARSDDFPDALSAPAGPVLLNPTARLDSRVAAALTRDLKPGGTVYLMGTVDVMSATVAQQVAALGFKAVRLGGTDRYATAAASASVVPAVRIEQPEGAIWDPCWFVLARGDDFPDALVARTLAAVSYTHLTLPTN
jgi:putative cell wall-binding protein